MSNLRIAIAAGGTAGHINPALALAEELQERGHNIVFVGQQHKLEGRLVTQAGFDFLPIEVQGFVRSKPWTALRALTKMKTAQKKIGAYFDEHGKPDVCVGFGAYVEVPLLRWACKHKVPYIIHEQNSVAGLANKLCAEHAAAIAVALKPAQGSFEKRGKHAVSVTGNPVRSQITNANRDEARKKYGIGADEICLLVFGGSLGAQAINEALVANRDALLALPGVHILHATGNDGYDTTAEALSLTQETKKRYNLVSYIDDMGDALAAADAVLSRAGASTIAELVATHTPSILVPYPHATADHQTTNACVLSDAGGAIVLDDEKLSSPTFLIAITEVLTNHEARSQMADALSQISKKSAATLLANMVEDVADRDGKASTYEGERKS